MRPRRGVPPAGSTRAVGPLPPARAALQALLRVGHRQVAITAPRLARRQRDDLLLRDRAHPCAPRVVCAPPARLLARLRGLVHALLRARRCPRDLRAKAPARLVAPAIFTVFQIVNLATANYGFFLLPRPRAAHASPCSTIATSSRAVRSAWFDARPGCTGCACGGRWIEIRIHRFVARVRIVGPRITAARWHTIHRASAAVVVIASSRPRPPSRA